MKNDLAVCTIISKNYLPYARVVAESFRRHNDAEVYVLLVDRVEGYFKAEDEPFTLIELEELRDIIPDFDGFCFQYTLIELNTAVKPYLLEYLFKEYKVGKLAYFDPDILITDNLGELSRLLDDYSIVITPHMTAPVDDHYQPGELEILKVGAYNLGFIGLARSSTVEKFLKWWQSRLHDRCIVAFEHALFVDQKWIDLVPGFYDDVFILREPGYNVAYWNYHCRNVRIEGDKYYVNDKPSYFFHFSGFDAENIKPVSKYQNRYTLALLENMRPLFELYRDMVLERGWEKTKRWPYYYACFDNGVGIPAFARRMYLDMGKKAEKFGNPFLTGQGCYFDWLNEPVKKTCPDITRLLYSIYRARPDLQKTFPDIFAKSRESFLAWAMTSGKKDYGLDARLIKGFVEDENDVKFKANLYLYSTLRKGADFVDRKLTPALQRNRKLIGFLKKVNDRLPVSIALKPSLGVSGEQGAPENGVNLAGYISSESGTGEAARANIRAMEAVDIPFALNNLKSPSRQADGSYNDFLPDNPYAFNLIHVNADQVPVFIKEKGADYFKDKYNIGFWYWELEVFPGQWQDRFKYFNEIWVASSFCQDAISKASPVPVVKIPPSVVVENVKEVERGRFGLREESFVFLFVFDFLSFFERKNPMAVIKSFKEAFTPSKDAVLLFKCSNSKQNPQAKEKLLEAASGCNVILIDEYLDKDELHGLMAASDCYVSLHRSEGFGLPLAEAMYLGKPVIATGYSSNMDFMSVNNSFPVKYSLVEIEEDIGPYKKGNLWAEPDTTHAAQMMRLVYDDRTLARETGLKASMDIKEILNPLTTGRRILNRVEHIIKEAQDRR